MITRPGVKKSLFRLNKYIILQRVLMLFQRLKFFGALFFLFHLLLKTNIKNFEFVVLFVCLFLYYYNFPAPRQTSTHNIETRRGKSLVLPIAGKSRCHFWARQKEEEKKKDILNIQLLVIFHNIFLLFSQYVTIK